MQQMNVNGAEITINCDPQMPLLWFLRDVAHFTGTKYGCGQGLCGACTVHLNGAAVRACQVAVGDAAGKRVLTIEGLSEDGNHPLQVAWRELGVAQCGYCQPGQIMQAADLLNNKTDPSDSEIDDAMAGNLCRCGTYPRIRSAIKAAASGLR